VLNSVTVITRDPHPADPAARFERDLRDRHSPLAIRHPPFAYSSNQLIN
jgi:hypothetical protein